MKTLMCAVALLAGLLFAWTFAQGSAPKANYKVTRLSPNDVGISCLSGAEPAGQKIDGVLILSCKTVQQ